MRPKKPWGIVIGTLVAFVALMGPWYLLDPLFAWLLPNLPISVNLKIALATTIVAPISLLIIVAALAVYGKTLRDIGINKPQLIYAAKAAVLFVMYFVVSLALQIVASTFFGLDVTQEQNLGYNNVGGLEKLAAFIPLVLLTPVVEEVIFRGFMFTGFRNKLPFIVAAVGSSAIFGLAHGQWNVGLDVFVLGVASCYLYETTKSLWPSIFLHILKNGVAFYLLYLYNGG